MAGDGLFVAKKVAAVGFEGRTVMLEPNTVVREGHPIMQGREELFEPLTIHYDLPIPDSDGDLSAEEEPKEPAAPSDSPQDKPGRRASAAQRGKNATREQPGQ